MPDAETRRRGDAERAESPVAASPSRRVAASSLIRAPNHLGDLVMALPALEADPGADVLVLRSLAPLLELVPGFATDADGAPQRRILALERGVRGFGRAVRTIRRRGYRRGVLLTPSFSSAFLLACAGVTERRGVATDGRSALLTEPASPKELAGLHRAAQYRFLVTGERAAEPPLPRLAVPDPLREGWRKVAGSGDGSPVIGIFPGGNAPSRRWDADRYADLVRRLAGRGARLIIFGGPQERSLAAQVAGAVALNVAGRTDLPLLAAALVDCDLLVTNDSGPMHLAAAVGTPTLSLWGAGDPTVTGPLGQGHRLLRRPELPCVPCVKNHCPRRGRGLILPDAERECLRLIEVSAVEAGAARACRSRETLE